MKEMMFEICIEIRLGVKQTGRKRKHECEHRDKEQDNQDITTGTSQLHSTDLPKENPDYT